MSLNVKVKPMVPGINLTFQRGVRLGDVQKDVTKTLNNLKGKVDLVVVVIPDNPSGIYGK
jgi:histidinol-phosphate/aromatic aminotransferase/cobyric acid decarboxylase-like protein